MLMITGPEERVLRPGGVELIYDHDISVYVDNGVCPPQPFGPSLSTPLCFSVIEPARNVWSAKKAASRCGRRRRWARRARCEGESESASIALHEMIPDLIISGTYRYYHLPLSHATKNAGFPAAACRPLRLFMLKNHVLRALRTIPKADKRQGRTKKRLASRSPPPDLVRCQFHFQ
jgi:hypothetical protein